MSLPSSVFPPIYSFHNGYYRWKRILKHLPYHHNFLQAMALQTLAQTLSFSLNFALWLLVVHADQKECFFFPNLDHACYINNAHCLESFAAQPKN